MAALVKPCKASSSSFAYCHVLCPRNTDLSPSESPVPGALCLQGKGYPTAHCTSFQLVINDLLIRVSSLYLKVYGRHNARYMIGTTT